jgi:hypothetical protein
MHATRNPSTFQIACQPHSIHGDRACKGAEDLDVGSEAASGVLDSDVPALSYPLGPTFPDFAKTIQILKFGM